MVKHVEMKKSNFIW